VVKRKLAKRGQIWLYFAADGHQRKLMQVGDEKLSIQRGVVVEARRRYL
jgi:hypothetical protein